MNAALNQVLSNLRNAGNDPLKVGTALVGALRIHGKPSPVMSDDYALEELEMAAYRLAAMPAIDAAMPDQQKALIRSLAEYEAAKWGEILQASVPEA